ncbi:MAG: deaminase [Chloroflexi bacterium]|nr:MAG: deaminase [Chloroflexota bacterium]
MGKLIYATIMSLDGYVNDAAGNFDWAMPSEEVHAFANRLQRATGTYLVGRRMYEVMVWWETVPLENEPPVVREYALEWRQAEKIVYSTTLTEVSSANTRLERTFNPEAVRALKAATEEDLTVGGPTLAAAAFEAGLVDEVQLIVVPEIVGGGTRALPDGVRASLQLHEQRRFENGMVYLGYRI